MGRHTTAFEFAGTPLVDERSVIPDDGTSVSVEYWSGLSWTTDEASPITSPTAIRTKNIQVRLTPDVGGFFLDDGDIV